MIIPTNIYATQVVCNSEDFGKDSWLHCSTPINKSEMLRFIGIIAHLGMVRLPCIEKYWSKDELFRKMTSRNRL